MLSSSEGTDSNPASVKQVTAKEKPERQPIFDLTKDCSANILDKNINLFRSYQNQREHDAQSKSDKPNFNKNKISPSRGYWHQQLMGLRNVEKEIVKVMKDLQSDTSKFRN